MTNFVEYKLKDAVDLAQLIKKRKITEMECFDAAVKRIEAVNPQLNAVIYPMYDEAKQEIRKGLPPGEFYGVPFLLKDLLDAYSGVPLTNGSRAFKDYVPDYDAETVVRYKQSGLNIIGKTNCPEFGLMGITEPELYGPTRNPWDIGRTPGGSSGGSAAAVSVGMVPAASAGDGGGSIRIPASHCGIFGLKSTRGRVPTGPKNGRLWQGATSLGVLSRSVRDSAKLLDVLSGEEAGRPYGIAVNNKSFYSESKKKCRSLKIAVSTDSPIGSNVDKDCISALKHTVKLLERLGHTVEYAKPEIDGLALARSYTIVYTADVAESIRSSEFLTGKKPSINNFELTTWILGLLGSAYSAADLHWAVNLWDSTARIMGEFHKKYDMYVTPTVAALPVKIGELDLKPIERVFLSAVGKFGMSKFIKKSGIIEQTALTMLAKTPFTQLANFTGQPAMSVPLFWNQDNLPIGSHFIAPFGDEATLFNLAGQLEKVSPWKEKRPNL